MKTKITILTVLCSASLWAWSQTVGGSSPAGNAPGGAAGKPPGGAPASPPSGAPGNTPNNGFNNNSGQMPPNNGGGSFQSPNSDNHSGFTGNDTNGIGDGDLKHRGILPNNVITNHPGIVKPNTRFYNGGTTNQ